MSDSAKSPIRGFVAVGVCVAGFLAYANTFTNDFVWDDASSVLLHKHVQEPAQFFQLFREDQHAFGRGQGNFYRPLVSASFMLDYALSRSTVSPSASFGVPSPSPFVFHLTNLAWHLAATLLLLSLLLRLDAPPLACVVVPLLYVVHPLHTEAITYISGRADPMAAALMFLGLRLSLAEGTPARQYAAVVACWICFAAALLCKESAFIFPVLLLLITFIPSVRPQADPITLQRRLIPLGGALVILAVYGLLRSGPLNFTKGAAAQASAPLGQRLIETGQAFASYLGLIFAPFHLHMERSLTGAPAWSAAVGYLLLFAGIVGAVAAFKFGQRRIALGLAWFFVTWLPISGIFPLNAPMAEHWLYVPLAGFLWALAELLALACRAPLARCAVPAAAFAVGVFFVALTVHRNVDWRNNESLYVATLDENPASDRVHFNLAVTYEDLLKNLPGAQRHYKAVLDLTAARKGAAAGSTNESFTDEEIESHLSLGKIETKLGDYDNAAKHYQRLLTLARTSSTQPVMETAALGMGKCFLSIGDVQQAAKVFGSGISKDSPLKPEAEQLLANHVLPGAL